MFRCHVPGHSAGLPRSGKNIWKMKFFPGREKSGNFVDGRGNLKKTWNVRENVREFENGYGRQSSENFLILFKRGKFVLSRVIV